MQSIRELLEKQFTAAARLFYRHNLVTLLILALFAGGLLCQLPKLTLDTSTEGFLHEKGFNKLLDGNISVNAIINFKLTIWLSKDKP